MTRSEEFDAIVVGGGPAGATCATHLAHSGRSVLLLDRQNRIKPCGGAIPPRLVQDFDIPAELLCARIRSARITSPSGRTVDMPINGGYVGMVNREEFDEFLRQRAERTGATRRKGTYQEFGRDPDGTAVVRYTSEHGPARARAQLVVGADGARSRIAKHTIGGPDVPCVFAYHEVIRAPEGGENFDGQRCDVIYDGAVSPDFYGWVFPHGATASVGTGSAHKGFSIRRSVEALRHTTGLEPAETIRREGAPIPLQPRKRWDNGRDVVLAGDAAGVVAPASGEGIYYAMVGGQWAAKAGLSFLESRDPRALKLARKGFMKDHGRVFWILGIMQRFWYKSDGRRERFVSMCRDPDVQELTWQAYMNKELVRAKPAAHVRIFLKDLAHLMGLAPT